MFAVLRHQQSTWELLDFDVTSLREDIHLFSDNQVLVAGGFQIQHYLKIKRFIPFSFRIKSHLPPPPPSLACAHTSLWRSTPEHAYVVKMQICLCWPFVLKRSALSHSTMAWVMWVTLSRIWSHFVDTSESIWHIRNLKGAVASPTSRPSRVERCARPTEP